METLAASARRLAVPVVGTVAGAACVSARPARPAQAEETRRDGYRQRLLEALEPATRCGMRAMRDRWVEEKGRAQLPAGPWPPREPKALETQVLRDRLRTERCPPPGAGPSMSRSCYETTFRLATALAFGKGDASQGLAMYRAMADAGDLDSTVASAVCLIEDIAGRDDEEGVRLLRAACAQGSAQAYYELGKLLLVGGAGLDEDKAAAFECFRQAAKRRHSAGMFMMADCMLAGVGCDADVAGAVPLLLKSACKGHEGARQQLEKMLDGELDELFDQSFGQAASVQLHATAE